MDIPGNSKASEVKDFVARELQMSPYTFKLQLGDKRQWVPHFGWIKHDKTSSKGTGNFEGFPENNSALFGLVI